MFGLTGWQPWQVWAKRKKESQIFKMKNVKWDVIKFQQTYKRVYADKLENLERENFLRSIIKKNTTERSEEAWIIYVYLKTSKQKS